MQCPNNMRDDYFEGWCAEGYNRTSRPALSRLPWPGGASARVDKAAGVDEGEEGEEECPRVVKFTIGNSGKRNLRGPNLSPLSLSL